MTKMSLAAAALMACLPTLGFPGCLNASEDKDESCAQAGLDAVSESLN